MNGSVYHCQMPVLVSTDDVVGTRKYSHDGDVIRPPDSAENCPQYGLVFLWDDELDSFIW